MVDTKSLEQTRKNWEGAIGRAASAYSTGVQAATNVISKAVAAEDLYAQKTQEAITSKRRARKLAEVTDEQWKAAATSKGAQRIGPGMTASKDKFARGINTVLETIRNTSIAPRSADPMANVDGRVKPIVAALAKLKE